MALISNFLGLVLFSTLAVLTFASISYNGDTHICCNGTVHDSNGVDSMSCCGNEAYNYDKERCCYGRNDYTVLLTIPDANDTYAYGCCHHPETQEAVLYNYNTQACCDGTAIDKPEKDKYYGCCGDAIYEYNTQFCCAGKVQPHDDNEACCGEEEVYDPLTQTCCTTYSRKDDGTYRMEHKVGDKLNGSTSTACCGLESYDYESEVCCNDVITPVPEIAEGSYHGCCGGTPYDYNKQICCQSWGRLENGTYGSMGTVLHDYTYNSSSPQSCCGLQLYNHLEEACCEDGTILQKPEGVDKYQWMSCCGGKLMTNYTTQICHNDELVDREGYEYYICGDKQYNVNTQFCCDGTAYDNDAGMGCCYSPETAYNTATEMCCQGKIEPLTSADVEDGNNACCAPYYYYQENDYEYEDTAEDEDTAESETSEYDTMDLDISTEPEIQQVSS